MRKRITKYKHLHSNRFRYLYSSIPLISASGLLVVGSMMLGCIGSKNVESMAYAEEVDVPVAVANDGILPEIALTVSNTNLTDTAGSAMATVSATTQLKVTAKNTDAYNIYVQSTSANSKLIGQVSGSTIDPIVGTSTYSNLPAGSWGYALGEGEGLVADNNNLSYRAVPTNTNTVAPAYSSTEEVEGKGFTLAFAAKFSADQPADHYKTNVVVSVAATPEEVVEFPGFEKIVFMQDLTPKVCLEASIGETKQLYDTRDMKSYWVTKLADGNCWMTQNLDYDIPEGTVMAGQTVVRYDNTTTLKGWPGSTNTNGVPRYYDPGDYYKTDTTNWEDAGCTSVADGLANASCADVGWMTAISSGQEQHFHVGNYYNWYAATNGSWQYATTKDMDASDSICPTGWKLPRSNVDASGSLGTTLPTSGKKSTDEVSLAGVYGLSNNASSANMLRKAPFYFVPGGNVSTGTIHSVGSRVNYWASTIFSDDSAYYFLSNRSTYADPTTYAYKSYGYLVRCMVDTAFDAITYMQEMTTEICNRAHENDTKQLIDRRDGKSYWVAKLADKKCWMVQNLDYDITTNDMPNIRRYDVTTGLDPQTEPAKTEIGKWPENTEEGVDEVPRYYDPGYYYKTNVTDWTYNNACHRQSEGLTNAACKDSGFTTTGDSHFAVGNYYNWYAATKGSGTNETVGNASDSICPAGWKLPESNIDKSGSFGTGKNSLAGKYDWSDDTAGALIPRKAPTYFVPSGAVRSGVLLAAGESALYWSSTAPSTVGYAYDLHFTSVRVNPANSHFVSDGFSVRCVNK